MLGRLVSREIGRWAPESFWGDTLPILQGANAVIANLECAISERGSAWMRTPKVFHFRAEPGAIAVLQAAGVRYVRLANNHVLDYEKPAFLDTLALLDEAGIARAGAGADLDEARRAARFEAGALKIAAFSVTDNEPPFAAGPERPGVCCVEPEAANVWPTGAAIQAERDAGAELLRVSAQLGPNMVLSRAPHLRAFKQRLLELGCDIVHGHSAHVFQGIETAGRRLILHDTGDFLDDYAVDGICRNDWSFLFLLEIDAGGVRRAVLRPVELGFAEVNLARGKAFDAICDRMVEQSAAFGTALERCTDGLELVLPAAG